jgi:hypothetical protein
MTKKEGMEKMDGNNISSCHPRAGGDDVLRTRVNDILRGGDDKRSVFLLRGDNNYSITFFAIAKNVI